MRQQHSSGVENFAINYGYTSRFVREMKGCKLFADVIHWTGWVNAVPFNTNYADLKAEYDAVILDFNGNDGIEDCRVMEKHFDAPRQLFSTSNIPWADFGIAELDF